MSLDAHKAKPKARIVPKGQWVPDSKSTVCLVCKITKFTTIARRHHCRKCGILCCGSCSKTKAILPGSQVGVRLCDNCARGQDIDPSLPAGETDEPEAPIGDRLVAIQLGHALLKLFSEEEDPEVIGHRCQDLLVSPDSLGSGSKCTPLMLAVVNTKSANAVAQLLKTFGPKNLGATRTMQYSDLHLDFRELPTMFPMEKDYKVNALTLAVLHGSPSAVRIILAKLPWLFSFNDMQLELFHCAKLRRHRSEKEGATITRLLDQMEEKEQVAKMKQM